MQHYLMFTRGNFYAGKQHSNKFLRFGARESGNYAFLVALPECGMVCCSTLRQRRLLTLFGLA